MTSGGSSRLHSTPVSHTRGNGSLPRASIQDRGVQMTGQHAQGDEPGFKRDRERMERTRRRQRARDRAARRCVEQDDHGADQGHPDHARPDDRHYRRSEPNWPPATAPARRAALARGCVPLTAPPAAAAGLDAQLTRVAEGTAVTRSSSGRAWRIRLPVLGHSRGRQGVPDERDPGRSGLPMIVMSMTCGEPDLITPWPASPSPRCRGRIASCPG